MSVQPTTTAWMQTCSGRRFNPTDENPDYTLKDLLWGNARECRYAGQLSDEVDFYSVAEHQVLMTEYFIREYHPTHVPVELGGLGPQNLPRWAKQEARTVAMHDAHEGLLKDMTRPMKKVCPDFCELEERFAKHVARRYDLIWPLPDWLKTLDNRILVDERLQLMVKTDDVWASDHLKPLGITVQQWTPRVAYWKYLQLLRQLDTPEADLLA